MARFPQGNFTKYSYDNRTKMVCTIINVTIENEEQLALAKEIEDTTEAEQSSLKIGDIITLDFEYPISDEYDIERCASIVTNPTEWVLAQCSDFAPVRALSRFLMHLFETIVDVREDKTIPTITQGDFE